MAYVVIGAMAVQSYVPYRTTRDLDVLIEASLENGERVKEMGQDAWPRLPTRPPHPVEEAGRGLSRPERG